MGWGTEQLTAGLAALSLAALAGAAEPEPAVPASEPPPASAKASTPEDLELLRELELLQDLELLRGWDPDEDLPIPAAETSR